METEQEISAGIIVYRITKEGPRFLLLYSGGVYWAFPKGKLDGESSFQAALREVEEETGLSKNDLQFRDWFRVRDRFIYTRDKKKIFKTVIYYLAEAKTVKVSIMAFREGYKKEQHYGYGWFAYRDAIRALPHQNLRQNLKKAHDLIIRRKSVPRNEKNFPWPSSNV